MTPDLPEPLVPIEIPTELLESPYKRDDKKVRAQAWIGEEDYMQLKSYFPRKGLMDNVISNLVFGFTAHLRSLNLSQKPQDFHRNELIITSLLSQYVPGTIHSRIKHSLTEDGRVTTTCA